MGPALARGEGRTRLAQTIEGRVRLCSLGAGRVCVRQDRAAGRSAVVAGTAGCRIACAPGVDAGAEPMAADRAGGARTAEPQGQTVDGALREPGGGRESDVPRV